MVEWLEYDFMQRALVATSVLSVSIAPVGAFLVLRRLSLAGEAMAHAIVPGIVIAFVIFGLSAVSMITGGLIAGIIGGFGHVDAGAPHLNQGRRIIGVAIFDCARSGDFYPVGGGLSHPA